jgi:hypothetical protein
MMIYRLILITAIMNDEVVMYSKTELENFISSPPGHVEVDFAVELARQLLQEKQVSHEQTTR